MSTYRTVVVVFLYLLVLCIFVSDVWAQIEIKISGAYQASDEAPFSYSERTREDMAPQLTGQEASFIFGSTPSISRYADSGAYQGYSYMRLRGIDQTRINVTLDGVPLNEPEDQGAYFSNYPDLLASVESFQVIRGVGTSQNGTASYAGSILLESPDLETASSMAGASAGSFGSNRLFAQYGGKLDDNQALFLRAAHLHSDGYRRRSGNKAQSIFYKWGNLDRTNQWSLTGFVGHQENELAYIGSTSEEIAADRRHNGNSQEDDVFTQSLTKLQHVRQFDSGDTLTTSIYYNHLQGNYDFDLNNFLGTASTDELFNYELKSHFLGAFSNYRTNFGKGRLTFGAHGNLYEREHVGSERTLGRLYENRGRKNELSAFTKLEYNVGDFLFLGDLQVRHTSFAYHGSVALPDLDWNFFNPKAGLTYFHTSRTNLYYSIGRTGREPTRNDIFMGNDDLLTGEDGAPLLGPTRAEFVVDHELGLRTKGESWSLQANAFYLDFENEIVLNGKIGPTGLPLTDSVSKSYRTGFEVDLRLELGPSLNFETTAAIMRSRIQHEGISFTPVMTPQLLTNHAIEWHRERLRLRADLRSQSAADIDFANTASIGRHWVLDLSAHYALDRVDLGIHLNNVFDEHYLSNGYVDFNGHERYFVSAPANVFLTATWKL